VAGTTEVQSRFDPEKVRTETIRMNFEPTDDDLSPHPVRLGVDPSPD
jgi:hypothetical protein